MPNQTVRRVLPHEYPRYRAHLKALDAESTILRFGFPCSNEVIDRLCDKFEADTQNHILFAIEDSNLNFIAVGHIAMQGGMELALSVLKAHQSKGLGSALMKRCIQWCRTKDILKGSMVCLSTNGAIRHLCVKHGIHLHSEHGETLADIELDHASLATYVAEAADSNFAVIDYMGKRLPDLWAFNK
jgi:GNAT superfamily N-acetyltransferase